VQTAAGNSPSLIVFAQENNDQPDAKWPTEAARNAFIKPLPPYPILCDEFKNGFKYGLIATLGWTIWCSFDEEQRQKAPILPTMLAFGTFIYTLDAKKTYEDFYYSPEKISCKWQHEMPLSQRIFSLAVKCRATKPDRRYFHERYKALRIKLDLNEPYDEEEKACDDMLSYWQKQSFNITPDTPKKTTCELHNELYIQAIRGIMQVRLIEGFMAGSLCALPAAVLLSILS
jgi:hypothetical protein